MKKEINLVIVLVIALVITFSGMGINYIGARNGHMVIKTCEESKGNGTVNCTGFGLEAEELEEGFITFCDDSCTNISFNFMNFLIYFLIDFAIVFVIALMIRKNKKTNDKEETRNEENTN